MRASGVVPRTPIMTGRGALLSAGVGVTATIALGLSPFASSIPPLLVPRTFIDLRFVGLPLMALVTYVAAARLPWPLPALAVPGLALSLAASAHWQGSAFIDLITELPGTSEGERVGIGRTLFSGASLLLSLAVAFDRARDRLVATARAGGVGAQGEAMIRAASDAAAMRVLSFAGSAFVALFLVARVGDMAFGASRLPIPELFGAAAAVTVAILLFPGLKGGLWARLEGGKAQPGEGTDEGVPSEAAT